MESTIYCPKCENFQPYDVREEKEVYPVKNEQVEIVAKVTYCKCCGEQVWNEDTDSDNLKIVFDEYRKRHGLLMAHQIKAIREKYGLSQVLFSKLLGLGEKTITRYENGSIQDAAHNSLLLLADDPEALAILLRANGGLLTESERQKVYKAVSTFRAPVTKPVKFEQSVQHM